MSAREYGAMYSCGAELFGLKQREEDDEKRCQGNLRQRIEGDDEGRANALDIGQEAEAEPAADSRRRADHIARAHLGQRHGDMMEE